MITLRAITEENFGACIALDVKEDQKGFVASNVKSLAQAWVYYDVARPYAIYHGETMVGFVMLDWDETENECGIWRLMIDRQFQGQGFGKAAMEAVLSIIRESEKFDTVTLDYAETNVAAEKMYRNMGFEPTGEREGNEIIMALKLRP